MNWVRILVVDGHARCEAVGIGHRLPVVRAVSVETAVALAGSGVPSVIRFADSDSDGDGDSDGHAEAAHASAGG